MSDKKPEETHEEPAPAEAEPKAEAEAPAAPAKVEKEAAAAPAPAPAAEAAKPEKKKKKKAPKVKELHITVSEDEAKFLGPALKNPEAHADRVRKLLALRSRRAAENTEGKPLFRARMATAPLDPRFVTTVNQAKHCWVVYNEWLRCVKQLGEKNALCKAASDNAKSLCPVRWRKDWRKQRVEKRFFGIDNVELTKKEEKVESGTPANKEYEFEDEYASDSDSDSGSSGESDAEEAPAETEQPKKGGKAAAAATTATSESEAESSDEASASESSESENE